MQSPTEIRLLTLLKNGHHDALDYNSARREMKGPRLVFFMSNSLLIKGLMCGVLVASSGEVADCTHTNQSEGLLVAVDCPS